MREAKNEKTDIRPGQDLVVAGFAGLEGTKRIARQREKELLSRFSKGYLERFKEISDGAMNQDEEYLKKMGAIQWEKAGEGGIHTALWNISGSYGLGFQIHLYRIPVRQETIEICEFYDLDPYDLYCKNCLVFVADNGGHMEEELKQAGIPAAWIGTVTEGIAREVFYGKVRRFMDRPREDELYKIIEREALQ